MKFWHRVSPLIVGCTILVMTVACNGILEDIYDLPSSRQQLAEGQIYMDATDWHNWYYIDFDSLARLAASGDTAGLIRAQTHFRPYPIPEEPVAADGGTDGIYTYWFDVFGKGLEVNEKRQFKPTMKQPEPASWSIAIHRNNVRTNGGAVLETNYTDLRQLPAGSMFAASAFVEDEWTENAVWTDQSQMLQSLIGSQGIKVNTVLSGWLKVEIPPVPPSFKGNNHVFIIRLKNGRYAAVQLENYLNGEGKKCWLTINYKYPYL